MSSRMVYLITSRQCGQGLQAARVDCLTQSLRSSLTADGFHPRVCAQEGSLNRRCMNMSLHTQPIKARSARATCVSNLPTTAYLLKDITF